MDPKAKTRMKKRLKKSPQSQDEEAETETIKILRRAMIHDLKFWGCHTPLLDDLSFEALTDVYVIKKHEQERLEEARRKQSGEDG